MKALPLGCPGMLVMRYTQTGKSGNLMCPIPCSKLLTLDALRASHPIEVPVKRADEINQIFDAISYSKGSSLLKMISRWLGEDVFIKGVSNYLKKHKWGNTQTLDLWKALSEASGKDVVKVMDIWTKTLVSRLSRLKKREIQLRLRKTVSWPLVMSNQTRIQCCTQCSWA